MAKMNCREWNVSLPWGNVAMISWGEPTSSPVLMVHGSMDSSASFQPLMEYLSDSHYYVSFDMPGLGKSDPFPDGPVTSQFHIVEVIRLIVDKMKWKTYIYMAHSMGFILGIVYNVVYPGRIVKMILLDPSRAISRYYYPAKHYRYWYSNFYDKYYQSYDRWNKKSAKVYTHDEAAQILVRSRGLPEGKAKTIIARSLEEVEDGKYQLTWKPSVRKTTTYFINEEFLEEFIRNIKFPTLVIVAKNGNTSEPTEIQEYANDLLDIMTSLKNCASVFVEGTHDVHITDPEMVAIYIRQFLKNISKL